MAKLYWGWLAMINLVAFVLFRYDKGRARTRGARRVPEATLLASVLAGGILGGVAGMMVPPRHKTQKPLFWLALVAASVLHGYLLYTYVVLPG